jgi:lipopolysaccharide export system protein LptC
LNQIQQQIDLELEDIAQHRSSQYAPGVEQVAEKRSHNLEFIGRERDIGDFEKAAKHSSRVGLLKYILPAIGVIIIGLILAVLVLQPKLPLNITIGSSGIEEGKLLMNNPKLTGFDPKNRAYSVEAARAIQSIEDPTLVDLEMIKAKLPLADNLWANITAGNGSFDVTEKKLELGGGVDIVTTDGMKLSLKDAYVDLKAGTMNTHRTINFTSTNASISSQSLEIFENGDRIVFDTNVLLKFQPPAKKPNEK